MPLPRIPNIDTVQETPVVDRVVASPPKFQSATVDTSLINYDQLTTHIAGQAWYVDYLAVVRGKDDDNRSFEEDLHAVYQQYKLIKGFELKVTSPLTSEQDSTTKDITLRGTANVYGVLIPNEGDVFFADIGDGREGLLNVTSSKRLSHYNSTVHEIEYSVLRYSDDELRSKFMDKGKVVEVLTFHKDFLEIGSNPLLNEEHTALVNNMSEHYGRLVDLYFHDFFSRNLKTLIVPNQRNVTYDPFIVRYIKNILTSDDHPLFRHITEFNVHGDQTMYEFTIWYCLEKMDHAMLSMSVHQAGLVDVNRFFNGRPTLNSVYYTGVKCVVYPDIAPTNVDAGYGGLFDPSLEAIVRGSARFRELDRLFKPTLEMDRVREIYEDISPALTRQINRVTKDDYYVFTEDFYKHTSDKQLSKLEAVALAVMKGEAIDIRILDELCTAAPKWDNVERFYYIPILLHMLKVYKRRIK